MEYKFTISGQYYGKNTLPGLNDYIASCNRSPHAGAKMKKDMQMIISNFIRKQLPKVCITERVYIQYDFYEHSQARDPSNVAAVAVKFIEDALQECKVLQGDGWKNISGFGHSFFKDANAPRIEITITEV